MKTKFITGGRQTGKTTQLIKEAVESPWRSIIIAADRLRANCIQDMLFKMYGNSNIVPVVTINAMDSPFNCCDIAAAVIDIEENAIDEAIKQYCINDAKVTFDILTTQTNPHIDHVKFNGPATIVFWKDGTKTVVKHDGKGRKDKRQAILYAFMRKIYGEGRSYHDILNEIEEALK